MFRLHYSWQTGPHTTDSDYCTRRAYCVTKGDRDHNWGYTLTIPGQTSYTWHGCGPLDNIKIEQSCGHCGKPIKEV